jgi:adenylate kinase family enzyme
MDELVLQRVAIVGDSCAGKTTFGRRLAERLGCPHVELDSLFWLENWVKRPVDDFRALVAERVAGESWVMDGNYHMVRDLVWGRATHVIWLNYTFPLVFFRAVKRTMQRAITQEALFSNNRETFQQSFLSKDSILWWVITTHRRRRRSLSKLMKSPPYSHLEMVELRSPRMAESLLNHAKVGDEIHLVQRNNPPSQG